MPSITIKNPAGLESVAAGYGGGPRDRTEGGKIHTDFAGAFPFIISGLKTLLETGQPLQMTGPDGS